MGQHFATVLHCSSRVLLQPDLHSDQTRDGQRLQWRADGSSMRALDSMTETETHHNDGAVSVACDQSQIESLSVARVPLIYISRRAKQKSDSASSHIKVPRYFVRGGPRGCGTCKRYARVRFESVRGKWRATTCLSKEGSPRALGLGAGTCIQYLYLCTILVRPTTKAQEKTTGYLSGRLGIRLTFRPVILGSLLRRLQLWLVYCPWIERPNDQRTIIGQSEPMMLCCLGLKPW